MSDVKHPHGFYLVLVVNDADEYIRCRFRTHSGSFSDTLSQTLTSAQLPFNNYSRVRVCD